MAERLQHLAERALSDIGSDLDPIPNLSAAIAQSRIEQHELPADELDGFICDCDDDECPFWEDDDE